MAGRSRTQRGNGDRPAIATPSTLGWIVDSTIVLGGVLLVVIVVVVVHALSASPGR